ncbi:hypothetical protein [Salipiger mangrovisoli]|uniref:Uncharacterized protein n=1 Tax=Salipiger mangrovisoli TaxID=2865933 RepID=A0ABR9WX05_9RHOB|nr:hypothetical protein [Salipiger mangrovisoli]MBE9635782.1 hypothetical protein [Salipiger mangrovisoli]
MPSWPSSLPFFSGRSAYELSGPTGHILRTQPSVGPAQRRLRTTAASRPFSGAISYMTLAQLAEFEAFYRDDLRLGSLAFDAVDPLTGEARVYAFAGEYKIRPNKLGVSVSAKLEIMP